VGGLVERLIKSTKRCLKKTIGQVIGDSFYRSGDGFKFKTICVN